LPAKSAWLDSSNAAYRLILQQFGLLQDAVHRVPE
jgi:hypothetical protein